MALTGLLATATYGVVSKVGERPSQAARQGASHSVPVTVEPATKGDIPVHLTGLGSVVPIKTVLVKSLVDGQLMTVQFREGQIVRKGDVLATVDPRPFEVQLTQAEGQMVRDQALLANARLDLKRYQDLIKTDAVPQQQLDTQESLVRQYEGTVKMDQGQIDNAKLQLTYARITAPVNGRLGLRQVDPGNIVHASDTTGLVVITQLQPIDVVFTIPEDNLPAVMGRLRAGETLSVEVYDRQGTTKLGAGALVTADNEIDPTTGTVKLKAQFPNGDYALFPNQFVNATLLLAVRRGATLIPSAAIQHGSQGTFVYVVNTSDVVAVRPVTLGPDDGAHVAVDAGVSPGERVVVDGADKLREGAKVQIAGPQASPAAQNVSQTGGARRHQHARAAAPAATP